ncbi:MAG TPA: chloride channel protein [Phycisphaerales bacterium]|nr:chloride channel protein [Phycisphaerales bacterium]HMP38092.1 chloride channel protein [Phycisphaerales bacterium]
MSASPGSEPSPTGIPVDPPGAPGAGAAAPAAIAAKPPRSLAALLRARLRPGPEWSLVIAAAGVGVFMSAVAMAFILPLHLLDDASRALAGRSRWELIAVVALAPVLGALLCGVIRRLIVVPTPGSGVAAVMFAIHRRQGRLPLRLGIEKWLASTATIGSGGSAGPEGPIVTIGAAVGSWLGRLFRTPPETTSTILGCAAAAGMASVFNAPIAGIFFVLEVLLRDFSLRTFTPIVIAAVIASAATQSVLGSTPLFGVDPALFAAGGIAFTFIQIPNYALLGVACGIVAVGFILGLGAAERSFARLRAPTVMQPMLGAAILGALGVGYLILYPGDRPLPPFYGTGYPTIATLLDPAWYVAGEALRPLTPTLLLLVGLVVVKAAATWLTLGSGGSGGLFAPSLLLGAALGAAIGHVVAWLGWFPGATPAQYALVGMAAMVGATSHAPLTAILLVYEITRSYEMILPLMLATVISTIVARLLFPDSVYTVKLASLGVRVGGTSDLPLLRRLVACDVPLLDAIVVHPDEPATRLLELTERTGVGDFVVLDRESRYLGMVTGVDLRRALVYREALPLMQVEELMRIDLPTVEVDETLDIVLDRFNRADVHCLVVLEPGSERRVRGVIARSRVLRRYQQSLDG